MIDIQWNDNVKARIIDSKQVNLYKQDGEEGKTRSQYVIYNLIAKN